ncbi:hypothetical protein GSI_15642 [Ganoderma sinense ZZ0214-1]|uniref:Uncharacterized protein n=1 Tax=Ganoderma sinense ZZ0214-1 TaxID=1077348 RepID=A0A2G8RN57_9APHY|nr:hypothetical protein GSI_15642 [Ganoderma sinense ZZ0214-1]
MWNTQQPSAPSKPKAKLRIQPLPRYPDIVLALNVIDTDPPRFHWYLFVPDVPNAADAHLDVRLQRGLKMHATTDYSPSDAERLWCFDATPTTLATDEGGLAAAATVGRLGIGIDPEPDLSNTDTGSVRPVSVPRSQEGLREMLARIPMAVPEADGERERVFTCRVWVREALRRMHEEGYVDCPDVDALEEEMWRYGRAAARAIEDDTFSVAELVEAVASRAVA